MNVDVKKIMSKIKQLRVKPKGKYIQDVYTFDFLPLEEHLSKLEKLRKTGDYREIVNLIYIRL